MLATTDDFNCTSHRHRHACNDRYTPRPWWPIGAILLATLILVHTAISPAAAHPHVWVKTQTEVVFAGGTVTGFNQRWTFDDGYTSMAIKGLDKNKDGTYSREELQELAQINIDGLKEFQYFTYARLGDEALKNGAPKDYWLDHKDGKLTLVFFLPLQDPVLADAKGLTYSIFDPSFFIAFDMAEKNPVRVSTSAPKGCGVTLQDANQQSAGAKRLQDALLSEFGGAAYDPQLSQTVAISCVTDP